MESGEGGTKNVLVPVPLIEPYNAIRSTLVLLHPALKILVKIQLFILYSYVLKQV